MARPPARSSRRTDGKATAAFIAVACCLLLLTGAYIWLLGPAHPPAEPPIGGAFALDQDHGRVVTERDFRGRYLLIYFGYTECADVCPTTLSAIADALDILGNRAADLQPIFITVDPKRDTPAIARAYAGKFSPRILGLGGTPDQIAAVEKAYRVNATAQQGAGGNMSDYSMSHTAALFLIGPDGRTLSPLSGLQGGATLARQLAAYLPAAGSGATGG
jgi:protein SCO1/2